MDKLVFLNLNYWPRSIMHLVRILFFIQIIPSSHKMNYQIFSVIGDVNEMQFLTPDLFSVGSSDGSVTLLRISKENGLGNRETTGYNLAQMNKWNLHKSR